MLTHLSFLTVSCLLDETKHVPRTLKVCPGTDPLRDRAASASGGGRPVRSKFMCHAQLPSHVREPRTKRKEKRGLNQSHPRIQVHRGTTEPRHPWVELRITP